MKSKLPFARLALLAATILVISTLSFSQSHSPTLTPQQSGTTSRLQAISPVNSQTVWASGVLGTFAVTSDGGAHWRSGVVPGAETLQFRDVEGVTDKIAYLLAAGVGTDSRIYKTADGGATWTLQFVNQDPNGFYDCFSFWTPKRGVVMGDSVAGRFPILRTTDGQTWQDIGNNLPPAQDGEAAFAASGTCIATQGGQKAWITTGGAAESRVIATTDGGNTWRAYSTPIVQGTGSSGGLSIAFRDPFHGVLGGGELLDSTPIANDFARTSDGGVTWQLATGTPFGGSIFGLAYAQGRGTGNLHGVVATGPGGAAWSPNEGNNWNTLPGVAGYWAVAFATPQAGWLVGTGGRILKISF